MLRIGGTDVDYGIWTPAGPEAWNATGKTGVITTLDVDNLASFVNQTGCEVLYAVDLYNQNTTPALALAELTYVKSKLGSHLYGVEIGNEPDLYVKPSNYTGVTTNVISNESQFYALWSTFAKVILPLLTSPTVLTGPALGGGDYVYKGAPPYTVPSPWVEPLIQQSAADSIPLALITQHDYPQPSPSASPAITDYLMSDTNRAANGGQSTIQQLSAALAVMTQKYSIPFRYDETNSYGTGSDFPVNAEQASALWEINHFFNIALEGGAGANIISGPGNTLNSNAPIVFSGGYNAANGVEPSYYGILLFSMMGPGPLIQTNIQAGTLTDVYAYTVKRPNGELDIMINNEDSTQNVSFVINTGYQVKSAALTLMTAPSMTATTGQTIQGATVGTNGSYVVNPPYTLSFIGNNVLGYVNRGECGFHQGDWGNKYGNAYNDKCNSLNERYSPSPRALFCLPSLLELSFYLLLCREFGERSTQFVC